MLAVLGAMKEEIVGLRRQMTVEETLSQRDCLIYKGKYRDKDMLLVQTGIGKRRAERAAELVLDRYPLEAMVSLGFAGALDKDLHVSDVILYSTLYFANESVLKMGDAYHSDATLILQASTAANVQSLRLVQGNGITVRRPLSDPEGKEALGRAFSAKAVDMESYWIARIAQAKGVPFLAVRAISDTMEERLLPFERFMDSAGWLRGKAARYFLAHPWQLAKLLRLGKNARGAERSLALLMDHFIAGLERR